MSTTDPSRPSSAADWPIAAAMLPFPPSHDASATTWTSQLAQVRFEGFDHVDLTDGWLRPGDLTPVRLDELRHVLDRVGLRAAAISAIRRSVIDPVAGAENLDYSHRTIDAAAARSPTRSSTCRSSSSRTGV
ncbi:MAG: hypothetical protein EOO67_13190, partial [Microbacterium sp.]